MAVGFWNEINFPSNTLGQANFAFGYSNSIIANAESIPWGCFLFGGENQSNAAESWVIGKGNIGQTETVTLGTYAATVPSASLIVGTGTGGGTTPRTNGLVVLKNGTVSIPSGNLQLGSESALTASSSAPVMASYLTSNNYLQRATATATASSGALAAWGYQAQATANGSLAFGEGSWATAQASIGIGAIARATCSSAIAIGSFSTASGQGALALSGANASGYASTALGPYTFAKGDGSVAIGYGTLTEVNANSGLAIGAYAKATDLGSSAVGFHAESTGFTSCAFGTYAKAAQRDSTAIGFDTKTVSLASVAIGSSNVGTAGNSGWNWVETDPILEVGNGYNGVRSNAISTRKNGQTTLINKFWSATSPLADPTSTLDSGGEALVVDGHTRLRGKVVIEQPQGDISMGIYGN